MASSKTVFREGAHYAATLVCTMVGSGLLLLPYCFDQTLFVSPAAESIHQDNVIQCDCCSEMPSMGAGNITARNRTAIPSDYGDRISISSTYVANTCLLVACALLQLFTIHLVVAMSFGAWRLRKQVASDGDSNSDKHREIIDRIVNIGGGWRTVTSFRELIVVSAALKYLSQAVKGKNPSNHMIYLETQPTAKPERILHLSQQSIISPEDLTRSTDLPTEAFATLADPTRSSSLLSRVLDLSVGLSAGTCLIVFLQFAMGQLSALIQYVASGTSVEGANTVSVGALTAQESDTLSLVVCATIYGFVSIPRSYRTLRYTSWTGSLLTVYLLIYSLVLGIGAPSWLGQNVSPARSISIHSGGASSAQGSHCLATNVTLSDTEWSSDQTATSSWSVAKNIFMLIGIYVSLFSCQYTIPILISESRRKVALKVENKQGQQEDEIPQQEHEEIEGTSSGTSSDISVKNFSIASAVAIMMALIVYTSVGVSGNRMMKVLENKLAEQTCDATCATSNLSSNVFHDPYPPPLATQSQRDAMSKCKGGDFVTCIALMVEYQLSTSNCHQQGTRAPTVFLLLLRVMLLLHFLGAFPLFAVTSRKAFISGFFGRSEDDIEQSTAALGCSTFSIPLHSLMVRRTMITILMTACAAAIAGLNPNKMSDVFALNGAIFANLTTISLPAWLFVVGMIYIVSWPVSSFSNTCKSENAKYQKIGTDINYGNSEEQCQQEQFFTPLTTSQLQWEGKARYWGAWVAGIVGALLTILAVLSWILQHS